MSFVFYNPYIFTRNSVKKRFKWVTCMFFKNNFKKTGTIQCFLLITLLLPISPWAQLNESEELSFELRQQQKPSYSLQDFFITSLYGTLIGSIIGTVTMSINEEETQDLRKIAQGASIGLYAGLATGLYTFYSQKRKKNRKKTFLPRFFLPRISLNRNQHSVYPDYPIRKNFENESPFSKKNPKNHIGP